MKYGFLKDKNGNKIYINDNSIYHAGKKLGEVINSKQDKLIAGTGIEITGENTINNIQGNYSTEEVKIGTWIDEKILYRKTILYNGSMSNDLIITHGIKNIYDVINVSCIGRRGKDINRPIPTFYKDDFKTYNVCLYDIRDTTLEIIMSDFYTSYFDKIIITLEYTKTTD
jgi:hypothetical protein